MKNRLYLYFGLLIMFSNLIYGYGQNNLEDYCSKKTAWYECSDPVKRDSLIDDKKGSYLYFLINTKQKPVNPPKRNLFDSSPTTNVEDYFIAYLVNNVQGSLDIGLQDGSLIMIQEAKDSLGDWLPIEHWEHSFCGNSYFPPLEIPAHSYLIVPIKRYEGDFITEIRLKLVWSIDWISGRGHKEIIYSEPFIGHISTEQFKKTCEGVSYLDEKE